MLLPSLMLKICGMILIFSVSESMCKTSWKRGKDVYLLVQSYFTELLVRVQMFYLVESLHYFNAVNKGSEPSHFQRIDPHFWN